MINGPFAWLWSNDQLSVNTKAVDLQSDEEGPETVVFVSTNTNSIIRSTKKIDSLCVITGAWGLDGKKMVIFVSEY